MRGSSGRWQTARIGRLSVERIAELLAITTDEVEELRSTITTLDGRFRMAAGLLATRRQDLERAVQDAPGTTLPEDASEQAGSH